MLKPSEDAAISFRGIGISSSYPPNQILRNISGYVVRGGITAILGPTASGKSLLMRSLSGRVHNLKVTGDLFIEGVRVDHRDLTNPISFVSHDDNLVGDLTPRESLFNSAAMKRNKPTRSIEKDVERMMKVLGIADVADNIIGTAFARGIPVGHKKRVEIGAELVAAPLILFLDEPTCGLDASVAFDVLKIIKDIAKASGGQLSIMLSIQQPNTRLLELFDHIMVLGGGSMNFFGTVPESLDHLSSIGFAPPNDYSPTDYFLHASDRSFTGFNQVNFAGSYSSSSYCQNLMHFLEAIENSGQHGVRKLSRRGSTTEDKRTGDCRYVISESGAMSDHIRYVDSSSGRTSFWRQYSTLVNREITMARRDPALYYMQFSMVMLFGFLVGAAFLDTKYSIDRSLGNVSAGLLWIVFMMAYIQIFKTYHLSRASARFKHEIANNTYSVLAAFLAELTVSTTALLTFIPGTAVAYFMMGFPSDSYLFVALVFWMTALTSESMLNFISRAWTDSTSVIIVSQAFLVILSVFGGGCFIPWDRTPSYWRWLQEISVFTQASRAVITHINDSIRYKCAYPGLENTCADFGYIFACDADAVSGGSCYVNGREMLYVTQGTSKTESPWTALGYLFLLFVMARLGVLILMYIPADRIAALVRYYAYGEVQDQLNDIQIKSLVLQDKLASMVSQLSREAEPLESYNSFKRPLSIGGGISHYENYNVEELFAEEFNPQIEATSPTSRDDAPYCLVWKNLSLTLKKGGTNVIDNVSGAVPAGTVLALMGPSGAGKTSLLNALGNRAPYGTVTGEITFGKTDFMKEDLYFVSHFDDLNGNLTVYEQMELVGLLRWVDGDDMHLHLDVILHTLGLFDKARIYCSELTRGELKKVSVGMGMISRPKVLFLDEPISGLDSSAAYSIVQHLADLAGCLKTAVIMTIHQPAEMVFDMLQDLYILEGGRLAYAGPMSCCEKYFKTLGYKCPFKTDVADFVMDILNKPPLVLHQSSWQTLYRNSKFCDNVTQEHLALDDASRVYPTNTFQPSDSAHLRLFFNFFFKYYCRDYWFYYHRILCLIAIALFSGTLFLNSSPESQNFVQYSGAIFFNMWTALFSAVAATRNLASDRRQAVEQIKNSVIKPSLYYFAQFMVSLPFNFVTALIFQSVFHWLTNINPNKESFIYSVLLTCGHLLLMESYMLLVVEVLKNAMLCVTFSMIIMGWLFLFAGFFIKVSDMPAWIRWVCYVTPTKYSFDGYLYQIFHSQEFAVSSSSSTSLMSGNYVLKEHFSQTGVRPWAMYGTLLAWIALIRLIHYGTHYYQMREFRSRKKSVVLGNLAPLMEKAALEDPSIA